METVCRGLDSDVALYNRLEENILKTWSIHNEPPGYKREDLPSGHICYDMTIRGRSVENLFPVVIEDLEGSKWEKLDSNVKKYGIKSYHSFPVLLEGQVVGSLCVVDTVKRAYSQIEVDILETFSKAFTLEEERKLSQDRLTRSNEALIQKNTEIKNALAKVKTLSGLLPIGVPVKEGKFNHGPLQQHMRTMTYFDGERQWNLHFRGGVLQTKRSRQLINFNEDRTAAEDEHIILRTVSMPCPDSRRRHHAAFTVFDAPSVVTCQTAFCFQRCFWIYNCNGTGPVDCLPRCPSPGD